MRLRSVFRDPAGWSEMVVGSRRRYLVTSGISAALGVAVVAALVAGAEGTLARLGLGALGYAAALEMPLYALRALRVLVVLQQSAPGRAR